MKKAITILILTGCLLFNSSCQEINIRVDYPDDNPPASTTNDENIAKTTLPVNPTAVLKNTPASDNQNGATATQIPVFDPYLYFFPDSALPSEVNFVADDKKTLFVSYLENPGSLFGIAHVREYESYQDDLFAAQNIIQSPIPGQPEMLRTGHHGNDFQPTSSNHSLGDYSLSYHVRTETENYYSYRFYKNNMIVVVDLRGFHPFVTEENVYRLAKMIYDKLPQEFPIAERMETPPLELHPELTKKYFYNLEMTTCQPPYAVTDPVLETELGYCFRADIIELIRNLKVGLYDEHYGKVVYMKEFLFTPEMGEWVTGFFFPVWGYSWQHFHAGEYQALFWVDDQLAASIPFTFVKKE